MSLDNVKETIEFEIGEIESLFQKSAPLMRIKLKKRMNSARGNKEACPPKCALCVLRGESIY